MAKTYAMKFGAGKASTNTGLSPTFTIFNWAGVTALVSPGITESPLASGIYSFMYGATIPVIFEIDGGSSLDSNSRYLYGVLDPIQAVNELVGTVSDSYGSTASDPTTLMGYAKRNLEFNEGNETYTKANGILDIYTRGSTALLVEKTITNSTASVTKT